MIDKKIEKLYKENLEPNEIIKDLKISINNMEKSLTKSLANSGVDINSFRDKEWDDIDIIRARYVIFYSKFLENRINDINWIARNKYKFPESTNTKIFKLILLRDKLSFENSIVDVKNIHPFFRPLKPILYLPSGEIKK